MSVETDIYFGHFCPKCGTAIGTAVSVGGPLTCPGCGGPMTTAPGGPQTTSRANVECPSCHAKIGFIGVHGPDAVLSLLRQAPRVP